MLGLGLGHFRSPSMPRDEIISQSLLAKKQRRGPKAPAATPSAPGEGAATGACPCASYTSSFAMTFVDTIPELYRVLDAVRVEEDGYVRVYRCRHCGQLWEQAFGGGYNADVPNVNKRDR